MPPDPGGKKVQRWYAIGVTTTNEQNPWKGASVQWTNNNMYLGTAVAGNFLDETLWIGTNSAQLCWIEVGDTEYTDPDTGQGLRSYYWAENSKANGYEEHLLNQPAYPPVGQFQNYAITMEPGMPYNIVIGINVVGNSNQPGDTLFAHAGLETTSANARIAGAVGFRNFLIFDGRAYHPWPNHTQSVDFPAWWQWNWPAAANGIPVPFLPFGMR